VAVSTVRPEIVVMRIVTGEAWARDSERVRQFFETICSRTIDDAAVILVFL